MCSIIGMTGEPFATDEVLDRLKRMEYRGYDSFGYWNGRTLHKQIGTVEGKNSQMTAKALGHTRWATHGKVTEQNAHPHRAGKTTIVHNGIIENWKELRVHFEKNGTIFQSETDSELIAWFIETQREEKTMPELLHQLTKELQGTFATVISIDGDPKLYVVKRGSPLLISKTKDHVFVASDMYAFSDVTTEAIIFGDDEYGVIDAHAQKFYKNGKEIEKKVQKFVNLSATQGLENYEHYMHKEIHEQKIVTNTLLNKIRNEQSFHKLREKIRRAKKIIFTACGSAYFASLIGSMSLHDKGIEAQALIASEFQHFATFPHGTLVIAVSQSGETMDVIKALNYAQKNGAEIASIVNTPFSSIEHMSGVSVNIHAGQEVAVASTKAFTNQALTILCLASGNSPQYIPELITAVLKAEDSIQELAQKIASHEHVYVLGRKYGYPVAREIALKIKEVSYIHAEGMMAGELKHGTIALIDTNTPVIGIVYNNDVEMLSSLEEVRSRGAHVITIGTKNADICVPSENEVIFSILAAITGQLLAYYLAKERDCPIDKPRNLAKSVTV